MDSNKAGFKYFNDQKFYHMETAEQKKGQLHYCELSAWCGHRYILSDALWVFLMPNKTVQKNVLNVNVFVL